MGKRSDWFALQQGRSRSDTGKYFNGKDNQAGQTSLPKVVEFLRVVMSYINISQVWFS